MDVRLSLPHPPINHATIHESNLRTRIVLGIAEQSRDHLPRPPRAFHHRPARLPLKLGPLRVHLELVVAASRQPFAAASHR